MAGITLPAPALTRRGRPMSVSERASNSSWRSSRLDAVRMQAGTPRPVSSARISGMLRCWTWRGVPIQPITVEAELVPQ
jgi:hypothetical protein